MYDGRKQGFTLVELLVVIGIIALLAAILLPVLALATHSARRANCSQKERQVYQGLRMYLNTFDEYFPLAWLRVGSDPNMGDLQYWRFAVQEMTENFFSHVVKPPSVQNAQDKFDLNQRFWYDVSRGYTRDYFASILIFKGPTKDTAAGTGAEIDLASTDPYDKNANYSAVVRDVPATERPILTEVDASYNDLAGEEPDNWKEYPTDNAHKADLMAGWTAVAASDLSGIPVTASPPNVFVGAAKSVRTENVYDVLSTRFDFRHNAIGNFLFLDGHVDAIMESNRERVVRVHERWNALAPTPTP